MERLPIHQAVEASFAEKAIEMALSGGEDYELLFTASAETIERAKNAVSCPVTIIGEIATGRSGEVNLIDANGNPLAPRRAGWDHFTTGRKG